MIKKNKDKIKPYKSLLSNMLWSFGGQLKYTPSVLFMQIAEVPLSIGISYAGIYLPSLVVAQVTENRTLTQAMTSVGLLMLAVLLVNMILNVFYRLKDSKLGIYIYNISKILNEKSLGCFYQTYESKKMRDLYGRALRATQQWDGVQPVTDMPKQSFLFTESIICYILFGATVSFVSPWLVPILTVAPVVNWLSMRAYRKWEYKNRGKWADTDSKLSYVRSKPADFSYAKDIRIYGMTKWLTDMYHMLCDERAGWDRKIIKASFLSKIADLGVILLRDGAAYAILIAMTLRGEITVDKFVLYFAAISSFATWVGNIINGWNALHSTSLKLCDLREYLDYPESDGTGEAKIEDYLTGAPEITFDNVCFKYDGAENDTLHNISFTMRRGEKLALVGLNGAGKTTLVKLLCGLYLPTSGEIRINGTPQSKFYRKDYYKLISPVFQDVKTAFFSLAETVSCVSEAQTDTELAEKCLIQAGLEEKIKSLTNGIHTKLDKQVNRDGTELSGGEAQKLMLARALYKNSPVLVLDEPTAALDPIAENEIYLKYNEMSKHKTSLFISHRLASTRFCDRILYLENGNIVEEGTHEKLLSFGGKYKQLFDTQSCWYKEEVKI